MLSDFMEKLSRDMELSEPLKAAVPNVYAIPIEEGVKVVISSPSSDRYELNCSLGSLPNERREAFLTRVLLANLFGQGTSGAILGTDIEGSFLTLSLNIDRHIDYKNFRDIVEEFFNTVDFWKLELVNNGIMR